MSLLALSGTNSVSGGFDIANSVKLEPDNAEFLKRNQADGNKRTWTYSIWVKRTELGMSNGMALFYAGVYHQATRIFFDAGSDAEKLTIDLASTGTTQYRWITKRVFRDTSAWYHFVWRVDTTQSTATDRMRMYVNGVLLTADDFQQTATFPQNTDTTANDANLGGQQQMAIGNYSWANNNGIYAGYAAQCALVDGESLAPTEFGEFDEDSGIWKPIDISGLNYGTGNNSFLLDFETASDLGANAKGNDANFTANNITAADQSVDTPTNSFAIGNAVVYFSNPTFATFNPITEGGTKITKGAGGWETLSSTIAVTSGKWYMEMQNISVPESAMMSVFPADIEFLYQGGQINNYAGKVSGDGGISYYSYNGNVYQNAGNSSYGSTWANETNTMAIALDMDNGKVYFARANTWQNSGNPTSGATGTGAIDLIEPSKPHMMGYSIYANNTSGAVNFGGYTPSTISSAASDANGYGTFEYAPPSGYYALCTKNLAEYG